MSSVLSGFNCYLCTDCDFDLSAATVGAVDCLYIMDVREIDMFKQFLIGS